MTDTELAERDDLADVDAAILGFQKTMEEAAQTGALDSESLDRFIITIRDAAHRMSQQVLPQIDAAASAEIGRRLLSMVTRDVSNLAPLDAADHYLVELEAIRHVIRDLLQEQHPQALRRQADETVALLEGWMPSVPVSELAELLGLSVRQLQRRRHDDGPSTSREQLVARLVAILRTAWTDAGVVAWFRRPRPDLGDRPPLDLLGDASCEPDLLRAARGGRVQVAS